MGLYDSPHMMPQTTKSLAAGAEGQRQKQIGAYKKDKAHNQSQMDSLRKHQYRRNADDANKQKRHMANNAAKSSRLVTGSSAYNKEEFTLQDFMDICEGRKPRKLQKGSKRQQRKAAEAEAQRKAAADTAAETIRKKREAQHAQKETPNAPAKKKNLAAFRAQAPAPEKKEPPREQETAVHGQKKRSGSTTTPDSGRGYTRMGDKRKRHGEFRGKEYTARDKRAETKWEIRKKQGAFAVNAARKREESQKKAEQDYAYHQDVNASKAAKQRDIDAEAQAQKAAKKKAKEDRLKKERLAKRGQQVAKWAGKKALQAPGYLLKQRSKDRLGDVGDANVQANRATVVND